MEVRTSSITLMCCRRSSNEAASDAFPEELRCKTATLAALAAPEDPTEGFEESSRPPSLVLSVTLRSMSTPFVGFAPCGVCRRPHTSKAPYAASSFSSVRTTPLILTLGVAVSPSTVPAKRTLLALVNFLLDFMSRKVVGCGDDVPVV